VKWGVPRGWAAGVPKEDESASFCGLSSILTIPNYRKDCYANF